MSEIILLCVNVKESYNEKKMCSGIYLQQSSGQRRKGQFFSHDGDPCIVLWWSISGMSQLDYCKTFLFIAQINNTRRDTLCRCPLSGLF